MPKGAALHLHSGSSGSTDWIVDEGIDVEGCYIYMGVENKDRCLSPFGVEIDCSPGASYFAEGMIAFYDKNVTESIPEGFLPTNVLIEQFGSTNLRARLRSLITSNKSLKDMDSSLAWDYFDKIFLRIGIAMNYKPFYKDYLMNCFLVHAKDNVQHIEIRALIGTNGLGDQYDFSGRVYSG